MRAIKTALKFSGLIALLISTYIFAAMVTALSVLLEYLPGL
jgi:hypothetical protein